MLSGKSAGPITFITCPRFSSWIIKFSYVRTTPFICGCHASLIIKIFILFLLIVLFGFTDIDFCVRQSYTGS